MAKEELLTAERLREILDYDPKTGIFIRKKAAKKCLVGKPAGCIDAWGYSKLSIDG